MLDRCCKQIKKVLFMFGLFFVLNGCSPSYTLLGNKKESPNNSVFMGNSSIEVPVDTIYRLEFYRYLSYKVLSQGRGIIPIPFFIKIEPYYDKVPLNKITSDQLYDALVKSGKIRCHDTTLLKDFTEKFYEVMQQLNDIYDAIEAIQKFYGPGNVVVDPMQKQILDSTMSFVEGIVDREIKNLGYNCNNLRGALDFLKEVNLGLRDFWLKYRILKYPDPPDSLYSHNVDTNSSDIKIYPNPAADIISFKGLPEGVYDYKIYSSYGNVVKFGSIGRTWSINVSGLKRGSYVILLKDKQGKRYVVRFLKD